MSEVGSKRFFFEKKNQKTFAYWGLGQLRWQGARATASLRAERSNPGSEAIAAEPGLLRFARNDEGAGLRRGQRPQEQKFFASFFQKRSSSLA
jgi:hypothetical protein